jgi:transposase
MNSEQLFKLALGLTSPWEISKLEFTKTETNNRKLDIYLDFASGAKFKDAGGNDCPVHDAKPKTWRHLDFFQHECYLHARVPRIKTTNGSIKLIAVPWARSHSGFTLLFEAFAMSLLENEMPVNKAAVMLKVYPNRIWTVFNYWIGLALQQDQLQELTNFGIDETSARKGHTYVTLAADLDARRVIFACPGKDEQTIDALQNYLTTKQVTPEQINYVSMDMSPAYISGITKYFPQSKIVFDRFHVVKLLNSALDEVRRAERRNHVALKGHKYTFLKNYNNLTAKQKLAKYEFIQDYPELGEACRLQELFNDFWELRDLEQAQGFLAYWCDLVTDSTLTPFHKFVNTIKDHWDGIINYIQTQISNGILEGINNKIQLAKRRARGYRNINNFIAMIYFIAGKLAFDYPLVLT